MSAPIRISRTGAARVSHSSGMSAYFGASVTLTGSGDPAQIRGARVTHEFFETMGVAPLQGRAFSSANGQAGGERVVIARPRALDAAVRRRMRPSSAGSIVLNGVPHEVVGVMPASFEHPADAELWMPLAPVGQFQELFGARGSYWLTIIGRLKPGVTQAAAQSEMDGIAARLEKEYPVERRHRHPAGDDARGAGRRCEAAAAHSAWRRVFRPADRVRQRREPAADARRVAAARARDPRRARRGPRDGWCGSC